MRATPLRSWRLKVAVQKLCSVLPFGDRLYRSLQSSVGGLRRVDPLDYIRACRALLEAFDVGEVMPGWRTVEIGTGWNVNFPLALYLCGARSCTTLDGSRYCRPRAAVRAAREFVPELMREFSDSPERSRSIGGLWRPLERAGWDSITRAAQITYVAPTDISALRQADRSADLVFSRATLQHIRPDVLPVFFGECARILVSGGRIWHRIDLFDQFSSFDRTLSRINYLRYSEDQWHRIASNRYAYANRLRISDYERLAEEAGFTVIVMNERVDRRAIEYARSGQVHADFASRDDRDLGTIAADLVGWLP